MTEISVPTTKSTETCFCAHQDETKRSKLAHPQERTTSRRRRFLAGKRSGRLTRIALAAFYIALAACSSNTVSADPPVAVDPPVAAQSVTANVKPGIVSLFRQSTAVYSGMKSYQHIAEYLIKGKTSQGPMNQTATYTLALERPNRFCYKSDEVDSDAAVSNGKTFINYKGQAHQFTRTTAPAGYNGINIVDDVSFTFGNYLIALMLQGDVYADKVILTGLEKGSVQPGFVEGGKKYDLLTAPLAPDEAPVRFYFDPQTHLLLKAIFDLASLGVKVTEIIENVKINKPIEASLFEYVPPKNAHQIARTNEQIESSSSPRSAF